tara:strand:- start:472 stop:732 length:261 start_codon:yes stop_codon:yes gene_type:complete
MEQKITKVVFKLYGSVDSEDDFCITLEDHEVDEFLRIWRGSDVPFAPLRIEKITEPDEDSMVSYLAEMKDKFSIQAMSEALFGKKD